MEHGYFVFIGFDKLVEIDAQKIKDNALMASKYKMIFHLDNVMVSTVPIIHIFQYFQLKFRLVVELWLISDDFQGFFLPFHMIKYL